MKKTITICILLVITNLYNTVTAQVTVHDTAQVNRYKAIFLEADSAFWKLQRADTILFVRNKYDTVACKLLISEDYNPFSRVVNGYIVTQRKHTRYETKGKNYFNEFVKYLNINKKELPDDYIVWDYKIN
jgi:hypothetical protein